MGYAHDWVSVAGLDKDEVLARLGLIDRSEPLDYPRRGNLAWALTLQGRVIFVADHGELSLDRIAELSKGASLVAARSEGNDCTSSVWVYEDGRQIWSVASEVAGKTERLYDEEVEDGLIVEGDPPSEFAVIRDRHLRSGTQRTTMPKTSSSWPPWNSQKPLAAGGPRVRSARTCDSSGSPATGARPRL